MYYSALAVGTPFYADPLFDGAHDAEFVWHYGEQTWWLLYLQNRYNTPLHAPGVPAPNCPSAGALCLYTDIGLASTPDQGQTWVYRGVAEGLDLPLAVSGNPMPPNSSTQQFGGATWWRPAVFRAASVYHGYWIYNGLQAHRYPNTLVIHYTSTDLKHWQYAEVARETPPSAYDSNVFRLADGRFILFSTLQGPAPGAARPLQSADLFNWTNAADPSLIDLRVGEGPHVTGAVLNDLSVPIQGYGWLNWQGGVVSRTADGGRSWQQQPGDLFSPDGWARNASIRPLDPGVANQGPLFPNGPNLFVLWFAEFNTCPPAPEAAAVSPLRSVLQLGAVRADPATGWLACNRSEWDFSFVMLPPVDVAWPPPQAPAPPVWSVGWEEAVVIALAEMDRWCMGWFRDITGIPPGAWGTTQQLWRNASWALPRFVSGLVPAGEGAARVWQVNLSAMSATTAAPLDFDVRVASNGTILGMVNLTSGLPLEPLRQFRRTPPLLPWDQACHAG